MTGSRLLFDENLSPRLVSLLAEFFPDSGHVDDIGLHGLPADRYFWRDNNGLEADLVFELETRLQPVEIKSGQTVTRDYIKAGHASARFAGTEALPPWLIYGGNESYERSGLRVIGWRDITAAAAPTPTWNGNRAGRELP